MWDCYLCNANDSHKPTATSKLDFITARVHTNADIKQSSGSSRFICIKKASVKHRVLSVT